MDPKDELEALLESAEMLEEAERHRAAAEAAVPGQQWAREGRDGTGGAVTVEELLEIEEIKRLRIMYSHYLDGGDLDGLVGLFCEDAVCEFGENYGGDWVGREAIRQNYANFTSKDIAPFGLFMHAVTNPWIRITGPDTANGRWYLLDLNLFEGNENPLNLFGIYDDVYHKVDGRWLIYRTRIDFLWPRREYHGLRDSA